MVCICILAEQKHSQRIQTAGSLFRFPQRRSGRRQQRGKSVSLFIHRVYKDVKADGNGAGLTAFIFMGRFVESEICREPI